MKRPDWFPYLLTDFAADFPSNDACLEWLKNYLYPAGIHCKVCGGITEHHRDQFRRSYSCAGCGRHFHPAAGTICHGSSTPLRTWFFVIYRLATSKGKISAKQIQRETGVTYKTAWSMRRQIWARLASPVKIEGAKRTAAARRPGRRPGRRRT